ncbi:MAG: type I secretion system permease/ATPase [Aliiglaciecola sp.]|uniref:type I secretion system permease/ATPase n=1 Tax=Aliiglaciecola sp. TaxID=1872441 RepID=UPI00329A2854
MPIANTQPQAKAQPRVKSVAPNSAAKKQTARTRTHSEAVSDPLIEGLSCLLKCLGTAVDPQQLSYGIKLENGRLKAKQLPQLLRRHHFDSRLKEAPLKRITAPLLPCLLLLKGNETLVLLERKADKYRLLSPVTGGELILSYEKLAHHYTGWSLFAHARTASLQSDSYAQEKQKHWFKSRLLGQWKALTQIFLASLLASVLAIASALFAMQVYDRVVPTSAFGTLWALAIGVLLAVTFEFLLRTTRGQIIETMGKRLDLSLSRHIFQHAINIRLANRPNSIGAFASQVRDFEAVREFFTASTLGAFGDLPFVLLFLGMTAYIGGPIVFIPITAILLMLLPALILQPWLTKLSRSNVRESAVKNGVLLEAIDNLETLKATHGEARSEQQWKQLCEEQTTRGVSFRHTSTWLSNWASATQQLASIGVIIGGVYLIDKGELTIGSLIACSILTARAIAPTLQINGLLSRWQHVKVALEGLEQLMNLPIERPLKQRFVRLMKTKGTYCLENVCWAYEKNSTKVLNLDKFTVEAGEHVALLGGNGAGKSTLLKILSGLYSPTQGEVMFDNLSLTQIDPVDRRRAIGYLPQDTALFHGTLRDNLLLSGENVDENKLLEAIDIAGLGDFVRHHPMGLDLLIQNNSSLSGGQRQSIGLARLILQDPQVVLLDEPTSALDQHTENNVIAKMGPWLQGRTLILATHKRNLLSWVNRAIVLKNGKRIMDDKLTNIVSNGQKQPASKPFNVKAKGA